jgi:hypothetical protein
MPRFVRNPTVMFETDSLARALLAESHNIKMPNLRLSEQDVEALLHFIAQETERKARRG